MKHITLILVLTIIMIACKTEIKEYPLKNAIKIAKTHPTFIELKAIVIEIEPGKYLAFTNETIIDSVITNFEVTKNRDCLKIENELKKWQEKFITGQEFVPFTYRDEFYYGDLIFSAKDRNHCIGISYCINSKTNIDRFKDMGIYMTKKDTIVKDTSYMNNLFEMIESSNNYIVRHKVDNDLSYYQKTEK